MVEKSSPRPGLEPGTARSALYENKDGHLFTIILILIASTFIHVWGYI